MAVTVYSPRLPADYRDGVDGALGAWLRWQQLPILLLASGLIGLLAIGLKKNPR